MQRTEINNFFREFETILDNKDKYNIEWAFKDAQEKIDLLNREVIDNRLKSKCALCRNQRRINKEYDTLKDNSSSLIKKQQWYSRIFSNMYTLLTVVEFIVSVILVLVISVISHSGEGIVESEVLGLWIVTTFAFLKVFLERYFVKPKMEELGWNLYSRSVVTLKDMISDFNEIVTNDLLKPYTDEGPEFANISLE